MSDEQSAGGSGQAAEMANELKARVGSLSLQDKLSFGGAAVYLLLAWLTWYEFSMSFMGIERSSSINGLKLDTGKLAWIAGAILAAWYVVPQLRQFAAQKIQEPTRGLIPLILGAILFLLGPIYFMMESGDAGELPPEAESMGASAGKTFFFWLSFLAAAAAVGGPAWKKFGSPED